MQCAAEVDAEGRELAYPSNFDRYGSDLAPERSGRWPLRMEFNLSNSCNLQCIQCNGLLSSSIRLHREGRPPLPTVYDDRFFSDLEEFIPHLVDAQFAGGEPFMAAETYRVWDLIRRLNPGLRCVTVTNATQWNSRVQAVIEELAMGFVFSLDGVTKETYEAVRIGADFDSVMANVERYSTMARRNGQPLEVNYCHMVQNYRELPDVLRWAEERHMRANVSVVRDPESCSLAAADDGLLRGGPAVLRSPVRPGSRGIWCSTLLPGSKK
ncbi:MAG: radical SAM protein [Microthrixaceae bacterium]|nr:radical SAM protein [Microthrixaceae bacterium]